MTRSVDNTETVSTGNHMQLLLFFCSTIRIDNFVANCIIPVHAFEYGRRDDSWISLRIIFSNAKHCFQMYYNRRPLPCTEERSDEVRETWPPYPTRHLRYTFCSNTTYPTYFVLRVTQSSPLYRRIFCKHNRKQ